MRKPFHSYSSLVCLFTETANLLSVIPYGSKAGWHFYNNSIIQTLLNYCIEHLHYCFGLDKPRPIWWLRHFINIQPLCLFFLPVSFSVARLLLHMKSCLWSFYWRERSAFVLFQYTVKATVRKKTHRHYLIHTIINEKGIFPWINIETLTHMNHLIYSHTLWNVHLPSVCALAPGLSHVKGFRKCLWFSLSCGRSIVWIWLPVSCVSCHRGADRKSLFLIPVVSCCAENVWC